MCFKHKLNNKFVKLLYVCHLHLTLRTGTMGLMKSLNLMWDRCVHQYFNRPYRLKTTVNTGDAQVVILLHGIGRSGNVWSHVIEGLKEQNCQVVAFDLLGFGGSPKPQWLEYTVDDHARAVIKSIKAEKLDRPVVLVGHSMGCLVAARVGVLEPSFVKRLILYEMPLYDGLPETRRYKAQIDLYYSLYNKIIAFTPSFGTTSTTRARKLVEKLISQEITAESWQPFVRSLENTIMKQSAASDIKNITVPIEMIYGSRDLLVIRGKVTKIFGKESKHITAHTINARHTLSVKASDFIVERIKLILN